MNSADFDSTNIWKLLDDECSVDEAATIEAAKLADVEVQRQFEDAASVDKLLSEAYDDPQLFGQDLQLAIIDQVRDLQNNHESSTIHRFQQARSKPWYQFLAAAAAILLLISAAQIQTGRSIPTADKPVLAAHSQHTGIKVLRNNKWTELKQDSPIYYGESVQNLSRTPVTLALHEGSKVTLRADCSLTLRQDNKITVVDLRSNLGGEIYCQVKHGNGRFKVLGHNLNTTVIGTRFVVRSSSSESFVGVVDGRVRVENTGLNQKSMLLTRDSFVRARNQGFVEDGITKAADLTTWLDRPTQKSVESVINSRPDEPTTPAEPPEKPVTKPQQLPESKPSQPAGSLDNPIEPPKQPK